MPKAAAYDLLAGCTGFVYAIAQAYGMLASGLSRCALVVGGDVLSKILDWEDRSTLVFFGDGAGAIMMDPRARRFLGFELGADGAGGENLWYPGSGSRKFNNPQALLKMNGREVFKFATRIMVYSAQELLPECGKSVEDIDVYIPHQANKRIIDYAVDKLGIPPEKTVVNVDRYGNTSSGSIPLALADARADGRSEGALVLMTGMGAGLTWGSALIEWTNRRPHEQSCVLFPGRGRSRREWARDRRGLPSQARCTGSGPRRPVSTSRSSASRRRSTLVDTEVQQPALVATSLAILAAMRERGLEPDVVVGHSVGEFAALAAAGWLGTGAAIGLVRERGLAMAEAARQRPGAMAAILGLVTRRSRSSAGGSSVSGPRTTGPGQIVISGEHEAVKECCAEAASLGARRAVLLKVSGAFHSPLVARAADRLRPALERVKLPSGSRPSCRPSPQRSDGAEVAALLVDQLTGPVRFTQAATELVRTGATTFVEVGPGNVLSGLVKRIDRGVKTMSVSRSTVWSAHRKRSRGDPSVLLSRGAIGARHRRVQAESAVRSPPSSLRAERRSFSRTAPARTKRSRSPRRSELTPSTGRLRPESARALVEEAGDLDILVNNAGVTRDGLLVRMSDDDWNTVIDTNLASCFYTCRAAARGMMKRRSGTVVNISSIVGIHGNWGQTNYAASKAGIIGFTKSLARELGSRNVRANVVVPGT